MYDGNKIAFVWNTADVMDRAKDLKVKVTKDQAISILQKILDKHDCNVSVTWDTIDFHIKQEVGL